MFWTLLTVVCAISSMASTDSSGKYGNTSWSLSFTGSTQNKAHTLWEYKHCCPGGQAMEGQAWVSWPAIPLRRGESVTGSQQPASILMNVACGAIPQGENNITCPVWMCGTIALPRGSPLTFLQTHLSFTCTWLTDKLFTGNFHFVESETVWRNTHTSGRLSVTGVPKADSDAYGRPSQSHYKKRWFRPMLQCSNNRAFMIFCAFSCTLGWAMGFQQLCKNQLMCHIHKTNSVTGTVEGC